ncbi:RNF217 isoform 9, partial [Pongo abelii]
DSIKYKYFLELGRIDSSTKPCPQCKHFTTFKKKGHIPTPSRSESKYKQNGRMKWFQRLFEGISI